MNSKSKRLGSGGNGQDNGGLLIVGGIMLAGDMGVNL
jgi:hypothetical protein